LPKPLEAPVTIAVLPSSVIAGIAGIYPHPCRSCAAVGSGHVSRNPLEERRAYTHNGSERPEPSEANSSGRLRVFTLAK
jgi:hypothetical protein